MNSDVNTKFNISIGHRPRPRPCTDPGQTICSNLRVIIMMAEYFQCKKAVSGYSLSPLISQNRTIDQACSLFTVGTSWWTLWSMIISTSRLLILSKSCQSWTAINTNRWCVCKLRQVLGIAIHNIINKKWSAFFNLFAAMHSRQCCSGHRWWSNTFWSML